MTDKKTKEIVKSIGRRLREAPELSADLPLPRDIELQLERLRRAEAERAAERDQNSTAGPDRSFSELVLAGFRTTD